MKYCRYCGSELADEAVLCVHCGRMVNEQPAPPPQNNGSSLNIMCLLGFIFAFVMPIVGLILSIMGKNQVKDLPDGKNKTFAKAGIIISSVGIGLSVLAVIIAMIEIFVVLGIYGSMIF